LLIAVSIEVPTVVSEKERALWEQLARESHFKPRD
jgi:hypothetical protein